MINFSKTNLFSMALLASAAAFTGCSSDEVLIEEEVTQAPAVLDSKEAVKTQFAINIPVAGSNKRLTSENAQGQEAPVFRGISEVHMFPAGSVVSETTLLSDVIQLAGIPSSGEGALGTANSKFYSEVSIPVGTSHMLFYAKGGTTSDTKLSNGSLIYKFTDTNVINGEPATANTAKNITFELDKIGEPNTTVENALATALSNIAKISDFETNAPTLYKNFTGLKSGSAENILYMVKELYAAAKEKKSSSSDVFDNIMSTIGNQTDVFTISNDNVSYTDAFAAKTYPTNLGIPAGVAQLTYDTTNKKFSYLHTSTAPQIGSMEAADFSDYVYPASLYYYVNTPIKGATSENITVSDTWEHYLTGLSQTVVDYSTKTVALEKQVQYGVGRFVVIPKFNATEVLDGKAHTVKIENNKFIVKGLLVGGQKNVGWNFTPLTESKQYTIYDCKFDTRTNGVTSSSTDNYQTLVLETTGVQEGNPETVNFAIEMVNNGNAFSGLQGTIPANGTFYLVGTLTTEKNENNSYTQNKVFAQDYVTKANVTIKSLANAYSVVPDLKSTKLHFGLSVDLEWQAGHTQDVTIE